MSTNLERILVLSDVHRPYHDARAWSLMMKVARHLKPNTIILNGDYADFYSVSSHSKSPERASALQAEVADCRRGLDELDRLGATRKVFIGGNHCDRLTRYLQDKAPELFGFVGIPELFDLKRRRWSYVPYKDHAKVGYVHFTHDVGASGRNATFRALDTYQHSVVTGHAHRLQYIVEGNAVGEHKVSAQFGWLGDVSKVDYMSRAKANKDWALGFGVGYHNKATGLVYLVPVPIVRYSCVVNGRLFR